MSTNEGAARRAWSWKRWSTVGFAVLCGLAYLVAGLRGGDRTFAFVGLGLMSTIAVLLLVLARTSETVAGLLDRRDERINRIDGDATTFAGMTLIAAVLAGFVIEVARGQDGQPFAALGATAGVAYVVALVVLRIRR
ncbi:hypothetical protein [Micromonospora sp. KC213]|uniref:hypothetical protein n=1 Tax=Micromonospora sp. KC213 TaxID=2530378 RepID=UPI001050E727|nr:hypothetical protein [Micromonospora sp. KC213]TDC44159.1 hypothetical protein E1166_01270 [Micromonospora sp. KC213]